MRIQTRTTCASNFLGRPDEAICQRYFSSGAAEVANVVANIERTDDSSTPLIKFLDSDELLDDDADVEKLSRQTKIYCLISNDLYKKAPNGVLLKCVSTNDGKASSSTSTKAFADHTPAGVRCYEKLFDKVSSGRPASRTLATWCNNVKLVNSIENTPSCQPKHSRPSLSHGRSLPGVNILRPFPRG